jgi:hypothetical protein
VFVFVLLSSIACVSAVPRADLPETSYNEVDAPVNLAPPAVPRVSAVNPQLATVLLSTEFGAPRPDLLAHSFSTESSHTPPRRDPHSLPNLLCTFLI